MDGMYYRHQGQTQAQGPITREQLKALVLTGKLGAKDEVYDAKGDRWLVVGAIGGLRDLLPNIDPSKLPENAGRVEASTTKPNASATPAPPAKPKAAAPQTTDDLTPAQRARAKARAEMASRGADLSVTASASSEATASTRTTKSPKKNRSSVLKLLVFANVAAVLLAAAGAWVWQAVSSGGPDTGSFSISSLLGGGGEGEVVPIAAPTQTDLYMKDIQPLLEKYCYSCHGPEKQKAKLNLADYTNVESIHAERKLWRTLFNMLHTREMPPEDKPQPTAEERDRITAWLEGVLNTYNCDGPVDPGTVTMRRMNRAEYNNTIRDPLAVDIRPADNFPTDDVGYGFDNIGDVLALPPLLMEKYLDAAELSLDKAIVENPDPKSPTKRFAASSMKIEGGGRADGTTAGFFSNGEAYRDHQFPKDGKYKVHITAWASQAGDEPAKMEVSLDKKVVKVHHVEAPQDKPETYETTLDVKKGKHRLGAAFTNDFYDPDNKNKWKRDRNLYMHEVEIVGPLDEGPVELPESHKQIFIAYPSKELHKRDAARKVIERFATRAFRRPVKDGEVNDFLKLFDLADKNGENYQASIKLALTGVMASPSFLFRAEPDRPTDDARGVYALNDYEIASRLSYFIWSSMPDDELMSLAGQGKLRDPAVIEQQVRRMLKDRKAMALVDNFAGQWLQLRRLPDVTPDDKHFPDYDEKLAESMEREAKMFFASVMLEDRPITQLLDADYTYLNERLAKHYGIEGVKGDKFKRVELPDRRRGGVLTMAAVLTVTSNPTRTSPVLRGKYILENILGTPPPPPPPDVGDLPDTDQSLPLRQRLEKHRSDPNCASCHNRMDPIGFGFENYNGIGQWREKDQDVTIDPSGKLPDGTTFAGPADLKRGLAAREEEIATCFTEKMLTYALGRGVEGYDVCTVREITQELKRDGYRFSRLIVAIAQSTPFLYQQNRNTD